MNTSKNVIHFEGLCLFFLLFSLWSSVQNTTTAFAETPVRIASTRGLYSGLLFIADQKGFFKEQGVGVEIIPASSGITATEMLLDGRADFIMLTEMAAANSILAGKNLALLSSTAEFDNSEIIARKDRGIVNPSDLKGKKIGLVSESASEYFLLSFLASNGLGLDDVVLVHIPANHQIEALTAGEVDAIAAWTPHTHRAVEKLGANAVHWPIQGIQKKFWLMAGLQGKLPQLHMMQKLVKALIEAESFVQANQMEAQTMLREYLNLPQQDLVDDWEKIRFRVVLPRELLNAMEFEIKWKLAQQGASSGAIPDFLDNILFTVLEEVRPQAVTILH